MTYTAYRDIDVMADGRFVVASAEVRYTFDIIAGIASRNWTNASDGHFYPAEKPTVVLLTVEVRQHPTHKWTQADGMLWDLLCADITDDWFIEQAMEGAE